MQIVAQSWLVYKLSDSAVYLGLDAFFGQIPIFLFSLVGGAMADRRDRKKLLLASQFVQLTCAFILALLVGTSVVQVWHIWCLSFAVGCAQAFGGPAYQALIPTLVGRDHLQNAIALNSIQFNVARIIGPTLGGIALSKAGPMWCFILNGLSFVAVIASLLAVRVNFSPVATTESVAASIKEGIDFLRKREGMMSLVVIAFCVTMFSYPLITFLPVFAKDVFHGNSDTFTILLCLSGAGSVTGALLVAASSKDKGQAKQVLTLIVLLGALLVGFGLSHYLPVSGAILYVAGLALMMVFALNASLAQLYVSDTMRGRVMSVYNVAFRGGVPIGSLFSGYLIKQLSAPGVIISNGLILCALGAYFLFVQRKLARM